MHARCSKMRQHIVSKGKKRQKAKFSKDYSGEKENIFNAISYSIHENFE
jgi:hypothetical protein